MKQRSYWTKGGKPPTNLPFCFNQMPTEEFEERFPTDPADLLALDERRRRVLAKLSEQA